MTYNFDPDNWYRNEVAALKARRRAGELPEAAFQAALDDLERRLEAMWRRLDGSYQTVATRAAPRRDEPISGQEHHPKTGG